MSMFTLSIPIILSTFAILFIAELPDKTALAALVLGTKYKLSSVLTGAWLAMIVQTLVAILAGGLLNLLPAEPVRVVSGIGFLYFAYVAYTRKEDELEKEEEKEVKESKNRRPVWFLSFAVVFAAEWGDISQLATAGIVAQVGHPISVGIGAIVGLCLAIGIAATAGSQLSRFIDPRKITIVSAVMFAIVGVLMIGSAFTMHL
jgi:putative Ca2+/H+ antiporter (TMEM165/GDT1 family)